MSAQSIQTAAQTVLADLAGGRIVAPCSLERPLRFDAEKSLIPLHRATLSMNIGARPAEEPFAAVKTYLNMCGESYRRRLSELAASTSPLHPDRKLTICIPVAAHQEEAYIRRCLNGFAHQTADPKFFEILLLFNHPDKDSKQKPVTPDGTIEAVKEWRAAHPHINVETMYASIPRESAKIGTIRGVLSDALLLRVFERGDIGRDHIMVRFDADADGAPMEYLEYLFASFSGDKTPELMRGPLAVSPRELTGKPLLAFSSHLFYSIFDHMLASGTEIHGGPNSACLVSTYAHAGGFDHNQISGEDSDLDRRIYNLALLRGEDIAMATQLPALKVYTSARRGEAALARGLPFSSQWDDSHTSFRCDDLDAGRGLRAIAADSGAEPTAKIVDALLNKSARDLEHYLEMSRAGSINMVASIVRDNCGIEVRERGSRLSVGDPAQVQRWFDRYHQSAMKNWHSEVLGQRFPSA